VKGEVSAITNNLANSIEQWNLIYEQNQPKVAERTENQE